MFRVEMVVNRQNRYSCGYKISTCNDLRVSVYRTNLRLVWRSEVEIFFCFSFDQHFHITPKFSICSLLIKMIILISWLKTFRHGHHLGLVRTERPIPDTKGLRSLLYSCTDSNLWVGVWRILGSKLDFKWLRFTTLPEVGCVFFYKVSMTENNILRCGKDHL